MEKIQAEIKNLLARYKGDTKKALMENPRLEYMYALSDMRENVLEWFPFKENGALLQVGSDFGALTGLYSRRLNTVAVLDEDEENLDINRRRHLGKGNVSYIAGSLPYYHAQVEIQSRDGEQGGEKLPNLYDYVVWAGTLAPPYEAQISAAKALLKPGGCLIAAACNTFGVKYWAGAKRDENCVTYTELAGLLAGEDRDKGRLECYYPMPDYKLATEIYSDLYLPGKGDLTDAVLAYDYPEYLRLDVGAIYDMVCEKGRFRDFANSYLMIWRDHGAD